MCILLPADTAPTREPSSHLAESQFRWRIDNVPAAAATARCLYFIGGGVAAAAAGHPENYVAWNEVDRIRLECLIRSPAVPRSGRPIELKNRIRSNILAAHYVHGIYSDGSEVYLRLAMIIL